MKNKLIVGGLAVMSMIFLASCAGDPAAMRIPEVDKLAHQVVTDGGSKESPSKDPSGSPGTDPSTSPGGSVELLGYKVPNKAHGELKMDMETGGTKINLVVSGDYDIDGEVSKIATTSMGEEQGFTLVDGDLYCSSAGTWSECGTSDFFGENLSDPSGAGSSYPDMIDMLLINGLEDVMDGVPEPKEVGSEQINGVQTTHYRTQDADGGATMDLWVDSKERFVRLEIGGKSDNDTQMTASWNYTNIDKSVSIKAPL